MTENKGPSEGSNPARLPGWARWFRQAMGAGAYPTLNHWLDPSRQYPQVPYARLIAELVDTGTAWLDAGCGHQIFKLRSASEEAKIAARSGLAVGCDMSLQALQVHRTLKIRVCADLRKLPFAKEAFDLITLNYVVEHLQEPETTFAELAALLRPQGVLVVLTPNSSGYFVKLARFGRMFLPESFVQKFIMLREFRASEDVFPTFYRANTKRDLRFQMEQAGLGEIRFEMLNNTAAFYFIAPLALLELLFGRLLSLLGLSDLRGGTLVGVYRKVPNSLSTGQMEPVTPVTAVPSEAK